MRAYDCDDPAHGGNMRMTGETDDDLLREVMKHRDEYHPDVTDDEIRSSVMQNSYDI